MHLICRLVVFAIAGGGVEAQAGIPSGLALSTAAAAPSGRARDVNAENLRRVEDRFVAPCCWRGSVAEHQSPAAAAMRAEIATLVRDGQDEEQIVRRYVARYGERILREPRGLRQFWLTLTPIGVLILGFGGVAHFLSRSRLKEKYS